MAKQTVLICAGIAIAAVAVYIGYDMMQNPQNVTNPLHFIPTPANNAKEENPHGKLPWAVGDVDIWDE